MAKSRLYYVRVYTLYLFKILKYLPDIRTLLNMAVVQSTIQYSSEKDGIRFLDDKIPNVLNLVMSPLLQRKHIG